MKDLRLWVLRKHGDINYILIQIFSGRSCFQPYLFPFKISETDKCPYCEIKNTAEHTLFACVKWDTGRVKTKQKVEIMTQENLIANMLKIKANLQEISKLANYIISNKEIEEKNGKGE